MSKQEVGCTGSLMRELEAEAGLQEEKAVLAKVFRFLGSLIAPFLSTDEGQVLRHADPFGGANQGEGARGGRAARASPGAGGRSGAAGEEERVEARGR